MAAKSHSREFEKLILRACSDPDFTAPGIPVNPIFRLRRAVFDLRHRMVNIDCEIDGYTMAHDRSGQLLAAFDMLGEIAGGISFKSILVLPDHRGHGLGAEIAIKAFESGVLHPETMNVSNHLTTLGRANRRAAHRIAVERAIKVGIDVAREVVADYEQQIAGWTAIQTLPLPDPRP